MTKPAMELTAMDRVYRVRASNQAAGARNASRKKLWKTGGKRDRHSRKEGSSCSAGALLILL
jgi:hypothetical protein